MLDRSHRNSLVDDPGPVSDDEAAAVAAAIGYNQPKVPSPLGKQSTPTSPQSEKSGYTGGSSPPSPASARSPTQLLKSPSMENLESPAISDDSSEEDVEDGGGVGVNVKKESKEDPAQVRAVLGNSVGIDAEERDEAEKSEEAVESARREKVTAQSDAKDSKDDMS